MASVKSTGLGSGLEINSIVGAIVGAEKDPAISKITKTEAATTAKISAFGLLNSDLSEFKSSYGDLRRSSTFSAAVASVSDDDILGTTLGIGAESGSWQFEVKQLAQEHTLVSSAKNAYASINDQIGTGEISLRYGSYDNEVVNGVEKESFSVNPDKPIEKLVITDENNSLAGLRDAINDGDYSVTASILNDGEDYRLVLTGKETGAEKAMEITVADDDGNNTDAKGLSSFVYSAENKNTEQTSVAQDAKVVMNGITISRGTNEIKNVIEGVTLDLKGETQAGKKVSLNINKDTTKVEDQINAFIDNYNNTISKMNELTAFNGEGAENAILNGDTTIRNIQNLMRNVLNSSIENIDSSIHNFSDLGLLTARDGTLELNTKTFKNVLRDDIQGVANFFTATGVASDPQITFDSNNSLTKPGSYPIEISQLATQGELVGKKVNKLTVDDDNDTFKVRLNGVLSKDINLSHGTYSSVSALATEMQSKINSDEIYSTKGISVKVTDEEGKLSFISNRYGDSSNVAIPKIDTNFLADFGIGVEAGTAGVALKGKIDGADARADGQLLISQTGNSTGVKVLVEGGDLGARGKVGFSEGMAVVMDKLLASIIDKSMTSTSGDLDLSEGLIDGKVDSLYKKLQDLDRQKKDVTYRTDKLEARLYKSFNSMDSAVSGLDTTKKYLKGALDALPGYNN